jgi:hypothetical protein
MWKKKVFFTVNIFFIVNTSLPPYLTARVQRGVWGRSSALDVKEEKITQLRI